MEETPKYVWLSIFWGLLSAYPGGLLVVRLLLPGLGPPGQYALAVPAALGYWCVILLLVHGAAKIWGGRGTIHHLTRLWGFTTIPDILLKICLATLGWGVCQFGLIKGWLAIFAVATGMGMGVIIWLLSLQWHALQVVYLFKRKVILVLITAWLLITGASQLVEMLAPALPVEMVAVTAMRPQVAYPGQAGWVLNLRTRTAFLPREPLQRGDIIIWEEGEKYYLGRLIALPGDMVEVEDGRVILNGKPLEEPYVVSRGNWQRPSFRVPENSYFVLGDNRQIPPDRYHGGTIPAGSVQGQLLTGDMPEMNWFSMLVEY